MATGGLYAPDLVPRVKLRICEGCNQLFNEAFEYAARPVLTRMMDASHESPIELSSSDRHVVSMWMIKVDLEYALGRIWRGEVEPSYSQKGIDPAERAREHAAQLLEMAHTANLPPGSVVSAALSDGENLVSFPFRAHPHPAQVMLSSVTAVPPFLWETVVVDDLAVQHAASRTLDPRLVVLHPVNADQVVTWPQPADTTVSDAEWLRRGWRHTNTIPLIDTRRALRKFRSEPPSKS